MPSRLDDPRQDSIGPLSRRCHVSRILLIAILVAGCAGGQKEATRTVTDTTVTPVHTTDTTVVKKQEETKVDTIKQTHNK